MNDSLTENNSEVHIHFEFIRPKSSFNILIYHTGTLTISGELKTGKFINNKELKSNKSKIIQIISSFVFGVLSGIIATLVCHFLKLI